MPGRDVMQLDVYYTYTHDCVCTCVVYAAAVLLYHAMGMQACRQVRGSRPLAVLGPVTRIARFVLQQRFLYCRGLVVGVTTEAMVCSPANSIHPTYVMHSLGDLLQVQPHLAPALQQAANGTPTSAAATN